MDNLEFANRIVHLTSAGFMAGTIVLNYFYATNDFLAEDPFYLTLAQPIASGAAGVSGIISVYLLKPVKKIPKEENKKADKFMKEHIDKEDEKEGEEEEEKKDPYAVWNVWSDLVKAKFALSLLLTPLVDPLVMFFLSWSEDYGDDVAATRAADFFEDTELAH